MKYADLLKGILLVLLAVFVFVAVLVWEGRTSSMKIMAKRSHSAALIYIVLGVTMCLISYFVLQDAASSGDLVKAAFSVLFVYLPLSAFALSFSLLKAKPYFKLNGINLVISLILGILLLHAVLTEPPGPSRPDPWVPVPYFISSILSMWYRTLSRRLRGKVKLGTEDVHERRTSSDFRFPEELMDRYTDIEYIGKGGFAKVFRVKRKTGGKVVAVKIPLAFDESMGRTFLKEVGTWSLLKHENIVELYDANVFPVPYLEIEYCESSLNAMNRPLNIEEAARLIFEISEGIKYAHSRNVVHRDLKPKNILIKNGIPKISDWGLSKIVAESTSTSITSFTPLYAAPEQISRKFGKPDKRTDIWQLGVIFYELVTGKLPFSGNDIAEIAFAVVNESPAPPSKLNPKAKDVESIIMKCLEKDQAKRYQSVEELQKDLAKYLGLKYAESLKESISTRDFGRSAYYCGELMLINLKIGDLMQAYKYATDLLNYAEGDVRELLARFCDELKYRIEVRVGISEELVKRADFIVHKIRIKEGAM